jgi:AraC family transcriptional regulator
VERSDNQVMTVDAELRGPLATVQLVNFNLTIPSDDLFVEENAHRLDLCLTPRPRNARACYRDHWHPHRFEKIGSVFLVPAGEVLHARGDSGRQESIVCLLHTDPMRKWFEDDLEWTDRRLEASLDISSGHIRSSLLRIAEETRHPGFASEMLVELIAAQMAIELSRYCAAITNGPSAGGLAPWRLQQIDERLMEVREAPTLAELARLCNLSVRQLTRGFRVSRNCSIGDYVARRRMENAKRWLAGGESIKTIAYSMGFASPSSFSYAFRRATGATPRQFRHRLVRGDA